MVLRKTVHGERLEERVPYAGVRLKKAFATRDAYCPRCGASPHRKCRWTTQELQGEYCVWTRRWWGLTPKEAEREAKRRRADHPERRERAGYLTALAERATAATAARDATGTASSRPGRSRLPPLLLLAARSAPTPRRRLERFDHLPLFQRSTSAAEDDVSDK